MVDPVSTPRTVLMTTDTVGGVWTYAVELAAGLRANGMETILAAMGGRPSAAQRLQIAEIDGVRLYESDFRLEWMDDPWEDVERAGKWLRELESAYQPDVIHLNNFAHGDLGWRSPVLMVGHSCVLSWWEAVKGVPAPREWETYAARVRSGLGSADMVVAPTQAMMDTLIRHYGPFQEHRVIPNAGDPLRFRPGKKEPFVLAAGRLWDEAKNIGMLARVAAKMDWPVRLAGPTGSEPVDDAFVTYLGTLSQTELAEQMAKASIYAFPAFYEPFGLSVLEAALSGCALILGDIPSLRENWSGCALFMEPTSPEDLYSLVNLLIEDEAFRDRLAASALNRARQFATEHMVTNYRDAYQSMLAISSVK